MRNRLILFSDVDTYIASFPKSTQLLLKQLRQLVKTTAPEATECISYQMPAYHYFGKLVYFAAYKSHIGFYPTSSGIKNFSDELSAYKTSKGAVQLALDQPLPLQLIKQIVLFRLKENDEKEFLKSAIKKRK